MYSLDTQLVACRDSRFYHCVGEDDLYGHKGCTSYFNMLYFKSVVLNHFPLSDPMYNAWSDHRLDGGSDSACRASMVATIHTVYHSLR